MGHETILVVDDEIIVLSLTSMMLQRFGYEVLIAASAGEALNLFVKWPDLRVDLLLVDIILPGMNGLVLAERIKELRPDMPVLYMSGYSERDLLGSILTRDISYLAKPFSSLQLTRSIRAILDKGQRQSKAAGSDV